MKIHTKYMQGFVKQEGLAGTELSRRIKISASEANHILSGERKVITGLFEVFPEKNVKQLFILLRTELNGSANNAFVTLIPHIKELMKSSETCDCDLVGTIGVSLIELNELPKGAQKSEKREIGGFLQVFLNNERIGLFPKSDFSNEGGTVWKK